MALCRVFSGVPTKATTSTYRSRAVTGPTLTSRREVKSVAGKKLGFYLCLGPSVSPMNQVHAGNIAGIIGLEEAVLRLRLASTTSTPLRPISQAQPMLRVALEPVHHQDLTRREAGCRCYTSSTPWWRWKYKTVESIP